MKLMIVGSDPDMRQRVTEWFSIDGEDLVVETSGVLEALWCAGQWCPDVIVFDAPPGDGRRREVVTLLNRVWPQASLLAPVWPEASKPVAEDDGRINPYAWNANQGRGAGTALDGATVSLLWYQPGLTHRHSAN